MTEENRSKNGLLQHVERISELVMRSTVWIVFVCGFLVSALVFARWVHYSFFALVFEHFDDPKSLMHTLLLSIELLILVPVPAIIGIVSYQTLSRLGNADAMNLEESKHQVGLAEHLLIGLLVTVTGTTLLDLLITGEGSWLSFGGGAILVACLSLFLWVNRH